MVYNNYYSGKPNDNNDKMDEKSLEPVNRWKRHDPETAYADENEDNNRPKAPRFSPPVYIQRYVAVQKVLVDPRYKDKLKKVVDFGCSELSFLVHLKNTPCIEEILCIDIDRETLEANRHKAIPLNADYLHSRTRPLTIHVCEGSVTHNDKKLANVDAVVAIELIEHLYPEALIDLPYNIFGYMQPRVVAITTPNSDFNVLFPNMGTAFRHWDHKFEWSRAQFEDWANNIVTRYPDYEVSFSGIGSGPPGTTDLGCCSQMAVFHRTQTTPSVPVEGIEGLLKPVTIQVYPYRVDNRSDEEKILDEATYHIRQFTHNDPNLSDQYPLKLLLQNLEKFYISLETLREILNNGGFTVRDDAVHGPVIHCPPASTFSDYAEEMERQELIDELLDVDEDYTSDYQNRFGTWGEDNMNSDYDDDDWDIEYRNPGVTECDNDHALNADTAEIDGIEIINVSHVSSVPGSIGPDSLSAFVETFESNSDNQNSSVQTTNEAVPSSSFALNRHRDDIEQSSSSIKTTDIPETPKKLSRLENLTFSSDHCAAISSMCSMYLESSRNDEREDCPENITNPSFDCGQLENSYEEAVAATNGHYSGNEPKFTSSPRGVKDEEMKSISQTSLQSSGKGSTTTSSGSGSTVRKVFPPRENVKYSNVDDAKLKGGSEFADNCTIDIDITSTSEADELDTLQSLNDTQSERQRAAPETLQLTNTTRTINENSHGNCSKENSRNVKKKMAEASPETPPNSWSPEIMDSGYPNSASTQDMTPECDLSSIAQDRISDAESPSADDDAPRVVFLDHPEVENGDLANNNRDGEGNNVIADLEEDEDLQPLIDVLEDDLENENDIYALENGFPVWLLRILERGNVARRRFIPENPVEIEVEFDAHAAGDAGPDEGFDSTSSEYDDDSEPDENAVDEISTENSEEVDWNGAGDC